MRLREFMDRIKRKIAQYESELPPGSLEQAIGNAVVGYSRIYPLTTVKDYEGDGTTHDFRLPRTWAPSFSSVDRVEYPVGDRDPNLLDNGDYIIYRTPGGCKLRLVNNSPNVGETVRVTFDGLHRVNEDDFTIPDAHISAVVCLAAAHLADSLASKYAGSTDPSMNASMINPRTKRKEYAAVADQFRRCFRINLGISATGPLNRPAASFGKIDTGRLDRRYGKKPL